MKSKVRTAIRFFFILLSILLVFAILGVLFVASYLLQLSDQNVSELVALAGNNGTPARIYATDENGQLIEYAIGELSSGRSEDYAVLDDIPLSLQNAFVAIEDKRYYSHIGFDPITTAKATLKYLFSFGSSPGGSTITQQLVKNLTGEDDITIRRKLTEIMTAVKLEKQLTKDSILELYLNSIYLSQGTYGVKAAARLYFDKDISDLTLLESAAIAAITQSPSKWDPILNPDNNKTRRDVILSEMLRQGYITSEEFEYNYGKDLTLSINRSEIKTQTTSWYTDAVINEAITLLSENLDISEKAATQYLYNGGYKITVAVNPRIQEILERYYSNGMLFGDREVESAFIVIDPMSGGVLGLVGGLGEKNASRILNRATQTVRSPGSAIKPLSVYLPAVEDGVIHYGSTFDDVPTLFGNEYPSTGWPDNADKIYRGLVDLKYAVAHSLNTVSVQTLQKTDMERSFAFLKELNFSTIIKEGNKNDLTLSALALGGMTKGVSLLELTGAYSVLANNGIYTEAHCIVEIVDRNGITLVKNTKAQKVLVKEETSQTVTKLLRGVIQNQEGTAHSSITKLPKLSDVAGKTGTTSDSHDRWFVGYTPYAIGGIWLGYDEPRSLSGINSKAHMQVWDSIMCEIHQIIGRSSTNRFNEELLVSARYCSASGMLPTNACYADPRGNMVAEGFFTKDTLPTESCNCHILINYCLEGKGVAGHECNPEFVTQVGLLLINRSFPREIFVTDAEYTAMELPEDYTPYYSMTEPYFQNYVSPNSYIGRSKKEYPFNRFCSRHLPHDVE